MKMMKKLLATAAACAALLVGTQAHADVTWQWSYTGDGVNASGTFTTAGAALTAEPVLSFSGQRNGTAILGLVPLDTDGNYSYDNAFTLAGNHFTTDGLLFDIGGGDSGHINLYYDDGDSAYHDLQLTADGSDVIDTSVSFSVAAVPEAATLAYMALGLGVVGFGVRRRTAQKNQVLPHSA